MNSSESTIIALIQHSGVDVSALTISEDCLITEIMEEEDYQQCPADINMVEEVAGRFLRGRVL